jgi:streptogramin lyase
MDLLFRDRVLRLEPDAGRVEVLAETGLLGIPRQVAVERDGGILVADGGSNEVARIDPDTGARSRVSGGALSDAAGLAFEAGGTRLISNGSVGAIVRGAASDPRLAPWTR